MEDLQTYKLCFLFNKPINALQAACHCMHGTNLSFAMYFWPTAHNAMLTLQAELCHEQDGISCEVIDLRTLLPWDVEAAGEHPQVLLTSSQFWQVVVKHCFL